MTMKFTDVNSGESLKEFATEHVIECLAKHNVNLEDYVGDNINAAEFIVELMRLSFVEGHMVGMNDGKDIVLNKLQEYSQNENSDSGKQESSG